MKCKQIEVGKTYTNGQHERLVNRIFKNGNIEYLLTKKSGKGVGIQGQVYRCRLQTLASWAKEEVL